MSSFLKWGGDSASASFLIAAIALTRFDYGFRVLLPVLRERAPDIGHLIEATLIVTPHKAFVSTGID